MFNYLTYRVFEYFDKKDKSVAITRTVGFMVLFQISLLMPLFIIVNIVFKFDIQAFGPDFNAKYYIGVPLAVFLLILNSLFFRKKLKGESLRKLYAKYHRDRYFIPIFFIFSVPVILVFMLPIIYGALNGTLHFHFPKN